MVTFPRNLHNPHGQIWWSFVMWTIPNVYWCGDQAVFHPQHNLKTTLFSALYSVDRQKYSWSCSVNRCRRRSSWGLPVIPRAEQNEKEWCGICNRLGRDYHPYETLMTTLRCGNDHQQFELLLQDCRSTQIENYLWTKMLLSLTTEKIVTLLDCLCRPQGGHH